MTTTTTDEAPRSTPWHFWVVAVISLLWNAIGGFDYTMSHLQGEAYLRSANMTEPQIAFIMGYPTWMHAVWAVGVWGSVLGSLLLLARSKWAFHSFALSTLGAVGALIYGAMAPAGSTMGLMFPILIVAICLVLVWYAWTMTKRGVLR
jgi:hypothetical protein